MILGYNTNGLAHHGLPDAVRLLAGIGYRGVGVTIDVHTLNPYHHGWRRQAEVLRLLADKHGLTLTLETGARYLLDPRVKHEPTLVSPEAAGRKRRLNFYFKAIDLAESLGVRCVSLWSGVVHDNAPCSEALDRLTPSLLPLLDYAAEKGVVVAFEPEPGMLIDTLAAYDQLRERLGVFAAELNALRLTIDIGHLHCQGETPIADYLRRYAEQLVNVHLEDMRAGVHEHLQFGEGEIDFPPVIAALKEIGYDGPLNVELSRHSHDGPNAARRAYEFLAPLVD